MVTVLDIVIAPEPVVMLCHQCGKDLAALATPEVVLCTYAGVTCANPCGNRGKAPPGGELVKCPWRTAPVEGRLKGGTFLGADVKSEI